jgi:hypothetical protein
MDGSDEFAEFLPKPRWRTRASSGARWLAVGVTFALIVALGWGVLAVVMIGLDRLGVPGAWRHSVWLVPTGGALIWALHRPQPATASQDEEQPWSDYAVRAVMIGVDEPRPRPARAVAGILFGAPLVVYLVITVVLEALGFF